MISSVNPEGGGPIEGVHRLGEALTLQGHTSDIASMDAPDAPWVGQSAQKVHALGPARSGYGYAPRLAFWLRRHASRYDAVTVEGLWQYHSLAVWQALLKSGVPYFVFPHGMLDPWFKRAYPLKHLKKYLYWLAIEHHVLRRAAGVCFTCEEERNLARQSFRPYLCREVVIPYGTSWPAGDEAAQGALFEQTFPELSSKSLLLFLGRLHPKKGCDLLLEAFAAQAKADPLLHLMIAGPDQVGWQAELQQQAGQLGIGERISWPGSLAGDLKWGAFRRAQAFVLPSHQENFGVAVAEALACGLPVLISNKINIWREIQSDGAGIVEDDTIEGTRLLLQKWSSLPEQDRDAMRRAALSCFGARFEVSRTASALVEVVQAARQQRGPRGGSRR